jgi:hypothetical protein
MIDGMTVSAGKIALFPRVGPAVAAAAGEE